MTSFKPITLKRLFETVLSLKKYEVWSPDRIIRELSCSENRAKEISTQFKNMEIIDRGNYLTTFGKTILQSTLERDMKKVKEELKKKYQPLREMLQQSEKIQQERGYFTEDYLLSTKCENFSVNKTTISTMLKWCLRLNLIQKNPYNEHKYLVSQETSYSNFLEELNQLSEEGEAFEYLEIPKIRAELCETLNLKYLNFDKFLAKALSEKDIKAELSGAPVTTLAKKRGSSLKGEVKIDKFLNPLNRKNKTRQGFEYKKRKYFYIRFRGEK